MTTPEHPQEQPHPWPTFPINRKWPQRDRSEYVSGESDVWLVQDMQRITEDLPVYDIPVAFLNLARNNFNSSDEEGLYGFVQHMKHVLDADLSIPIIIGPAGEIMDGRHRLAKALLEGIPTIKAKRIPWGTAPTYRK